MGKGCLQAAWGAAWASLPACSGRELSCLLGREAHQPTVPTRLQWLVELGMREPLANTSELFSFLGKHHQAPLALAGIPR